MIRYDVVSLRKLMEFVPESRISEMISSFSCTMNRDVESYLKNEAMNHEKRHISRTYFLFAPENPSELVAYFSIAVSSFETKGLVCSEKLQRKLNINRGLAQSYLIGQIGKRDGAPKGLGEFAIRSAMDLLSDVNSKVGCRIVRIDCKDALMGYYERNGFGFIRKNGDLDLNQMVRIIA